LIIDSGSVGDGVSQGRSEEIWEEKINAEYRDGESKEIMSERKS
jgi:hypothetical protein